MFRTARHLLLAVAVSSAIVPSWGLAQEPLHAPAPAGGDRGASPILESLPRPPDLPVSLFAPAPSVAPECVPLERPYFVPDPLLDPPQLPPPGWFGGLELDLLEPHLKNELINTVQNAAEAAKGASTTVALPSAPLDWAAAPQVFVGYRLPAGFGEVALAYRGLATRGREGITEGDGPATLTSRLDFNIIDLDYSSREFAFLLWPHCDTKWTIGVRTGSIFFDSRADQPFAQAAIGSGIFQKRETDNFCGVGPHAGLELAQHLANTGLTLVLRTDLATQLGRVHQGFFTLSTTPGPDGRPLGGETRVAHWVDAPMFKVQAGVGWQPPSYQQASVFLGYQYEYWWRVGAALDTNSRADLWDQGVVLQAALHF
jgi:hypothetical protein